MTMSCVVPRFQRRPPAVATLVFCSQAHLSLYPYPDPPITISELKQQSNTNSCSELSEKSDANHWTMINSLAELPFVVNDEGWGFATTAGKTSSSLCDSSRLSYFLNT